ncbi:hypothetical protein CO659_23065 [Rhizobium sp. S9]|uniref:hypothetical protein n=1 Tax=unclassified Rhizobium TaxID=2613769 RepID=UPI000A26E1F4|nr:MULTISPECIES: hypothetical protein [unclassified Rhizobium]PDS95520.1 hypothetical protein CO659_23065 [Rhizobium sp. S9]
MRGEAVLQAGHLEEPVEAAIFLIGRTFRNRSLLAEDRRTVRFVAVTGAIEAIDVLVSAGGILPGSFTGRSRHLNLLSKSYVGLRQFLNVAS